MYIKYNGTNVHALTYSSETDLKMNQSPQEVVGLLPGWNEFPKKIWEQNKNAPSIQKMLKKGTIELMEDKVTVRMKDKKTGKVKAVKKVVGTDDRKIKLTWFDVARAVEIAKNTYHRDTLQRYLDEENRHPVKRALEKQIKPLLNDEAPDADEDWEDVDDDE